MSTGKSPVSKHRFWEHAIHHRRTVNACCFPLNLYLKMLENECIRVHASLVVYCPPRNPLQLAGAGATFYNLNSTMDLEEYCLKKVGAGDTCYLEEGDYYYDAVTWTDGTEDDPITITGDPDACLKGTNTQDRLLQIMHNYYIVDNICFDGSHDDDEYVATAIYVLGVNEKSKLRKNGLDVTSSVTGLVLRNLEIKNFDSECIHFRYFVTWAEVTGCTIQYCGREDFDKGGDGKVGEGIYIGTALDQVDDGKVSTAGSPFWPKIHSSANTAPHGQ